MTLKTDMPISYEHKVHRIYHQHHHHHHYHLHHTLDHHHLHIHNQSIQRAPILSHHRDHSHSQQNFQSLQRIDNGQTGAPLSIEAASTTTSISELPAQSSIQPIQALEQNLNEPLRNVANTGHQMLQASGLTHLIARHNQREQRILAASHSQQARSTVRSKQRSQIQFLLLSALTYILSPIDLIPEAIFGVFGILDDLVFLFMCLFCVAIVLLYPLFREVRRTMFEKLGFKQKRELENKSN